MVGVVLLVRPDFDAEQAFAPMLLESLLVAALGASVYVGSHLFLWQLAGRPTGFEENVLHYGGRAWTGARERIALRLARRTN